MQAVILAGGLATRMRPLTESIPKCMLEVSGQPFLALQLELLKKGGIDQVLLCLGHLAGKVQEYFKDGTNFDIRISYSIEDRKLLGTAGALKQAASLLEGSFLLLYGDSYLDFSYADMLRAYQHTRPPALLGVYKNQNQWDKSNVVLEQGMVKIYNKNRTFPGMDYIDAGISILSKEILKLVPEGIHHDLAGLYQTLAGEGRLSAYPVPERFYEVGSPEGLAQLTAFLEKGSLPS